MGRIFAAMYDRVGKGFEQEVMRPARERLLADVTGRVLEIGAGTGANLELYPDGIELTVAEPDPHMRTRLRARLEELGRDDDIAIVDAPAEDLPAEDGSVDAVVSTMVLCSVGDVAASLREVRRMLRPSGRFLFIEHVRSDEPRMARWQDRVTPIQRRLAGNCHPNRDVVGALGDAGLGVTLLEEFPRESLGDRLQPMILGSAVRAPVGAPVDR